ncbi:pantoate--beta-alanine ligase [Bacillus sp. FJAT-29790]|uniref:pantoate--beta-alanine ligase n=1 Tax=Bacillus sp. FJAT-29790 TaxID=1895002 RepID=UPI001C24CE39|nr:pantoate--beta-alanine ligase [Bacillus sp. FJAT-29790]MBU8879071.1 pantoate--beta-alanine ligase [Bacillus sp. FJAT-29790]
MKIITTINEMQTTIQQEKKAGKSIGFVPTMGFLHEGHLTLMKKAREENDLVVVSIFVNPLQFGPKEDLSSYPRDFERDQKLAEQQNVDMVFFPTVEEMYQGPSSVIIKVEDRTEVLCGKSRPGHFDGVATVVTKLFNIVQPTKAYFGMKDAQQIAVIDGLVKDLNFPLEIVPVETVREHDGLAKSSRNVNLNKKEREQAPVLYQSLNEAKAMIEEGEKNPKTIIAFIKTLIEEKTDGIIDYVEIYSYPSLKEIARLEGTIIVALAVKFSKARLIDNLIITIDN